MSRKVVVTTALLVLSAAACAASADGDPGTDREAEGTDGTASSALTTDYRRTVVYMFGQTIPGQDMFVRGGIDHGVAKAKLGYDCAKTPSLCAIPIRHRSTKNATTAGWKQGDTLLDWGGPESGQGRGAGGSVAQGSPLDWTTNYWPDAWGAARTIDKDGYGLDPMNVWGMHAWKLDVDMDCSKAFADAKGNRWFELKSFISNGPGWEGDANQAYAPYKSINHFAQCGKINVFSRGDSMAQITGFAPPKSVACDGFELRPAGTDASGTMTLWTGVVTDPKAIDFFVAQSNSQFTYHERSGVCGQPFDVVVTRRFPDSVKVEGAGSARKLTASGLTTYNNGWSFTSGQFGTQVSQAGDRWTVGFTGLYMPCSHAAATYDLGQWTFSNCSAQY